MAEPRTPLLTSHQGPPDALRPETAGPGRAGRPLPAGISAATVGGTVGARLTATFLSFVAGIITARALGAHGRGVLALLIAIPAVFSVVGLIGRDTANLRFAGRSHTAFRQIARSAVAFALTAGTAISAAWLLAGALWPAVLLGLIPRLALLSALLCPAALLLTLLGAAEVGRGRLRVYNLVTAATVAIYLAAIVALSLRARLTVIECFAAYAAGQLAGIVAFLVTAGQRVHDDGERLSAREYRRYALRAYLPNIAQYGMLRMDVPVIQVLAGTASVALYAVALPFAETLLLLPVAVSLVMFPQVTSRALGKAAAARMSRMVLAGMALVAAAVALAAPLVVPAVYGTAFAGSVAVIWCMLPGVVVFSGGRTLQTYLTGTDRLRPVINAAAAGVTAGLVALVVLVPRLGAAGAGAADSAAYVAYAAVITRCLRRDGPVATAATRLWLCCGRAVRAISGPGAGLGRTVLAWSGAAVGALAAAGLSTAGSAAAAQAAGVLVLGAAMAAPAAGCCLLAIAIPVSQTSAGAGILSTKFLLALVIASLIGQIAAGRAVRWPARMVAVSVTLIAYFMLSTVVAGGQASPKNLLNVIELGTLLLCLPLIVQAGMPARLALSCFSFSAACVAIAEIATAHASLVSSGNISTATSSAIAAAQSGALNHNVEGALLVLALCVLLPRLRCATRGITRLGMGVAIAVLLAGVAYSFSRSSYFGAAAVLVFFALRHPGRGLIGLAVAAGITLPLVPAAVLGRIDSVWNSSGQNVSAGVRLDLWAAALRMFARQPLQGVGYLHFAGQLPAYFTSTADVATSTLALTSFDYAHNTYLTVLAQTGVIGAALVGVLAWAGWRTAGRAARSGDATGEAALLAFAGLGTCSVFGEPLFSPAVLAAFLLMVYAAARPGATAAPRAAARAAAGPGAADLA